MTTTWENVRSRDEAELEARQGRLESIQLVPSEFGGAAVTENIVFAPSQARAEKDATNAELRETNSRVVTSSCRAPD